MNTQALKNTINRLFADDKGILAIDESNHTCNQRFAIFGIAQTETERRNWRELIITTPRLSESISGVILSDETIRQSQPDGKSFRQLLTETDILIGIKVDKGTKEMLGHPGETITEGLDGLRERLLVYIAMGADFAKWRAAFHLGHNLPSQACIETNCMALADYASLCQKVGLVPIVEPEILMEGEHSLAQCYDTTGQVLRELFLQLELQAVALEALILKPNMILPGLSCVAQSTAKDISEATVKCLRENVPARVGGIAFLSGGQSPQLASARLNDLEIYCRNACLPWPISFSFARAIQQPALAIWRGNSVNRIAAQRVLFHRASCDRAARRGEYTVAMENG
jgi:fructose-bisphosphate aldolase, class I